MTRRRFFGRTAAGIGGIALTSLLNERLFAAAADPAGAVGGALPGLHFAPKAKRVIYLFMSGGPSHIDLFDYKPQLRAHHGQELPGSVRMGQRVTGMTAGQSSFPCVAPMFEFKQQGHVRHVGQRITARTSARSRTISLIVKTVRSTPRPSIMIQLTTFIQTGSQQPLRDRPFRRVAQLRHRHRESAIAGVHRADFTGSGNKTDQPIFSRLWGNGFLPSQHQGVRFQTVARGPRVVSFQSCGRGREIPP